MHSCYQYRWESALYGETCQALQDVQVNYLIFILNNYYSAWGLVDGVDMLEGPL
jgi:hypothetical protein